MTTYKYRRRLPQFKTQPLPQLDLWSKLKSLVYLKSMLFALGVAVGMPLLKTFYWLYDARYLARFGIGPEMLTREVFSSNVINVWLFAESILPFVYTVATISLIPLSIQLFRYCTSILEKRMASRSHEGYTSKAMAIAFDVIDQIERAFTSGVTIFLLGAGAPLAIVLALLHFSGGAEERADEQIMNYLKKGICGDLFSNGSVGCYQIPGEEGDSYLLIADDKDRIAYMDRGEASDEEGGGTNYKDVLVIVKNKADGSKLVRQFVRLTE